MKHRILVVAEDAPVRATLARWLMAAGYAVELAESPKRAREVIENEAVALAILAPQRLDGAGQELARELRGAIGRLIIVIEPPADAGHQTAEAIESDGSISKPLDEAETLEKVKAALPAPQKEAESLPDTLYFEGHILDVGARQCRTLDGRDRLLTRGEFTTLLALARQSGRVVSRDELRQAVAGRDAGPDDRSVDVAISRLRRKIELDPKEPRIIVTVPGEGYRLAEAAQSQDRHVPVVAQPLPPSVVTDPSMIETRWIDTRPPPRRTARCGSGRLPLPASRPSWSHYGFGDWKNKRPACRSWGNSMHRSFRWSPTWLGTNLRPTRCSRTSKRSQ
jgi:two-component system OmpR family response regulator